MEENSENRVNELISELSDCREDERNTQNQILEVISVTGTILGIIFSASYLNTTEKNNIIIAFSNINITYARILFWLSLIIFSTAFTYIIVLGTNNILRYYYIQTLEDRLLVLIPSGPDDKDRGKFLHWNAYSAPIITRNINHITSTHTALIYICYSVATCCAVLFSIVMVTSLFLEIKPKEDIDHIILWFAITFMLLTVILFLRTSSKAKEVAQFAWDTAHENQEIRSKKSSQKLYGKGKSFRRLLLYFIYPKIQDPQKPLLIILGFIYGTILMNYSLDFIYILRLIFIIIVFDFLAYQARYQINDIRGLKEDKEAGCKNRLLSNDINNPEHIIKLSLIIAFTKIVICIFMTIFLGQEIKKILLTCLGILFISTLLYEFVRAKKITWLVFVLVGAGYPLRFYVGLLSIQNVDFNIETIFFILALWSYGSFSSILSWANEVTDRMQKAQAVTNIFPISYQKKHFTDIQKILINRYHLCKDRSINGKVMPLREKGSIRDPWNLSLVLCLSFLLFIACRKIPFLILLRLEWIVYITYITNIFFRQRKKILFMGISWVCIVGKILIALILIKIPIWYLLFSLTQIIITITYFILCYQPQFKKVSYKMVFYKFMKTILGEYAVSIIYGKNIE